MKKVDLGRGSCRAKLGTVEGRSRVGEMEGEVELAKEGDERACPVWEGTRGYYKLAARGPPGESHVKWLATKMDYPIA